MPGLEHASHSREATLTPKKLSTVWASESRFALLLVPDRAASTHQVCHAPWRQKTPASRHFVGSLFISHTYPRQGRAMRTMLNRTRQRWTGITSPRMHPGRRGGPCSQTTSLIFTREATTQQSRLNNNSSYRYTLDSFTCFVGPSEAWMPRPSLLFNAWFNAFGSSSNSRNFSRLCRSVGDMLPTVSESTGIGPGIASCIFFSRRGP